MLSPISLDIVVALMGVVRFSFIYRSIFSIVFNSVVPSHFIIFIFSKISDKSIKSIPFSSSKGCSFVVELLYKSSNFIHIQRLGCVRKSGKLMIAILESVQMQILCGF